jgi:hypothetical protein
MLNICTSDMCKNISIIFVLFLALYLIVTNSKEKVREYFGEEDTETKIIRIWKAVYLMEIPDDTLQSYLKDEKITKTYFDEDNFKDTLYKKRVAEIEQMINDAFESVLHRLPTPHEKKMYIEPIMLRKIKNRAHLERIIANSPELATRTDATRDKAKEKKLNQEDFRLYRKIIDVYKKVLDRLPSSAELNFYFAVMKKNPKFDLDKLEETLIASREHMILEMNQKNEVNGDLEGNVTERQLKVVIYSLYETVYGAEPDKITFDFLRTRFVDMSMNEEKFVKFLKELKYLEDSTHKEFVSRLDHEDEKKYYIDNSGYKGEDPEKIFDKYIELKPDIKKYTMDKPEEHYERKHEVDDIGERRSFNVYVKDPNDITTDDILKNIRESDDKCLLGKYKKNFHNSNELANEIKDRDADLLDYRKNLVHHGGKSDYVNADENMVLYPEFKWAIPERRPPVCYGNKNNYNPLMTQTALIGTPLNEAKDTEVGSIMPKFKFETIDG